MRKTTKVLLVAVGCVAIGGAFLYASKREAEPTYKGGTLVEWTRQYEMDFTPEQTQEAAASIRAMCTNDIPGLLSALAYDDTPRRQRIRALLRWLPDNIQFRLTPLLPADRKLARAQAAQTALRALGPEAAPAIPGLINLMTATNDIVCYRAIYTLSQLGSNGLAPLIAAAANPANPRRLFVINAIGYRTHLESNALIIAVPVLLQCAQERDRQVVRLALSSLAEIAARGGSNVLKSEPRILPALSASLSAADPYDRVWGVSLLRRLGPLARPAAPVLLSALQDPDREVRRDATNALIEVAPELLTNAPALNPNP